MLFQPRPSGKHIRAIKCYKKNIIPQKTTPQEEYFAPDHCLSFSPESNTIPNTFIIVIMSHWSTFLKELYINAQWYYATVVFILYLIKLILFCACYSDRKAILRLYSLPFHTIRLSVASYIVTIILPHIQEICGDWCTTKLIRHYFLYFLLVLVFHGNMLKGDSLL